MRPSLRLKYLLLNAFRNLRDISPHRTADHWREISLPECRGQSPSRLLLEGFLSTELPRLLPNLQLTVIEIGCGSGSMTNRLAGLGFRGRYTGIDVQDRFSSALTPAFAATFRQMDVQDFLPNEPADLIISVSALEHIPNDDVLIARIPSWSKVGGIEIHAVPAAASLIAYLWHGYRQYSVKSLRRKFGPEARIVPLGGMGTLLVHLTFITVPELLLSFSMRRRVPRTYAALVKWGCAVDRILPFGATAHVVIRKH